jgi:hypothetical protein
MRIIRHSHPASGTHYRQKVLAEATQIRGGCGYAAGQGYIHLDLGQADESTPAIQRTLELRISESEAREIIAKLEGDLATIDRWRAEQLELASKPAAMGQPTLCVICGEPFHPLHECPRRGEAEATAMHEPGRILPSTPAEFNAEISRLLS